MPWKKSRRRPLGLRSKGPWGSGTATVGQGRPISRTSAPRSGPAAAIVAGGYSAPGYRAGSDRRLGDLGTVRIFPRPVRRARCRACALASMCVRCSRAELITCRIRSRPCCCRRALRVSTISIGMTLIDDPARRGRTCATYRKKA